MADLTKTKITAQEFHEMYDETMEHVELIEGEIVVAAAPKPLHQMIAGLIYWQLMNHIMPQKLGQLYISPTDLYLGVHDVVQPDVMFISKNNIRCKIGENGYFQGAPDICIEVLSPGTRTFDIVTKFGIYQKYGIPEYWIVDPVERYITLHFLEGDSYCQHGAYAEKDTLKSVVLPELSLNLGDIFPPEEN